MDRIDAMPLSARNYAKVSARFLSLEATHGMSVTQDKLVLTMAEESGGIWLLDYVDR